MTRLSININKVALLRNARGNNIPDVIRFAEDCERYGAEGITVHPRPDERHIRRSDVFELKKVVHTEFNIEGYPDERFLEMVLKIKPEQCTLVPDAPGQLTSDHGWDTVKHRNFLCEVISRLKAAGVRISIFIDPVNEQLAGAAETGTDRVELYTGPYAHNFSDNREKAVAPFAAAAAYCRQLGLGLNAGHDLNLDNLRYFCTHVPGVQEVSIGHAFVRDCLYYGLENTIQLYRRELDLSAK